MYKNRNKKIDNGEKSGWDYGQLQNIVYSEMNELLSHAIKGEIYFKYGKKQRMLESTYLLTDSLKDINQTPLGEKILILQHLYNSI